MNNLTFKEWSILSDLETIAPLGEDFEFSMARGELKTAQNAVKRLMTKLKGEGDLEAWVQSKITKAAEYLDTVADHLSHGEDDTVRTLEVKEGFKGHKSVKEIAKKHKVSPSIIQKQLEMGMKVEHEHTTDNDAAMDIALQHLDEIPNYYSKLKKVEKVKEDIEILDANGNTFAHVVDVIKGSDYKFKSFTQPITEDAVSELESQLKKLNNTSYDSIDKLMRNIMKEHDMTAKELHSAFIKKHDKTPDDWIKGLNEKCWDGYKQVGMKKKKKKMVPNCVPEETKIQEASKSGDDSLHDWFAKSKSSDGKPGWVQLGGKYAGKPCAKQPGQTTKPKCGSSKMAAEMSPEEEERAAERKRREDPNPDRKGKAINVATEEYVEEDACKTKVKSRYKVWPSAYASGALVKCRKVGAANWGNKSESIDIKSKDPLSEAIGMIRYCPKCKKTETRNECKYGPKYWDMFSIQPSLASDAYDPTEIHPANEQVSFDIGPDHNSVKKTAKIRNLATKTTNPNEKSVALKKLSGPSLPLADSVIQPGQLTNEDYQRIQSTGNVYTILFSWRGRTRMNLQLFFPSMKRPSKEEVKSQIEKLYPGAIIMQWHPSPTDPSKPIIVIQGN